MTYSHADTIHRLIKQLLDNGTATSIEEAQKIFSTYRIHFHVDPENAGCRHHQVALLTAVALARRVFLGCVEVSGGLDRQCLVPTAFKVNTLEEAVVDLGGRPTAPSKCAAVPFVTIGGAPRTRSNDFDVRAVFDGWRGGVVPADVAFNQSQKTNPLAPILAAAFSVNEAFFHVQGKTPTAGRRNVGLSLWDLTGLDWLNPNDGAPETKYLPSQLWLIGLGHLGQAYLWALGVLPYKDPSQISLLLQDIDDITPSTFSTSILTEPGTSGRRKTREMGSWAEALGFKTTICERRFDTYTRRSEGEPMIALCGLDNAIGRQALDQAGFSLVVEAGLGRGHRDFRTMRLHTLPGSRRSSDLWKTAPLNEDFSDQLAYQKMLTVGTLEQCGVTLLAGKAVGAPFVGLIAACLVISEVLRLLHGGPTHELIDLDLQSIEHRHVVKRKKSLNVFNPGFVRSS